MIFEKYLLQDKKPEKNIQELQKKESSPTLLIFLSDYTNFQKYTTALHEAYPSIPIIGTTGMGFSGKNFYDGTGLSVLAFDQNVTAAADVLEHIDSYPLLDVPRVDKAIQKTNATGKNSVCFEYCTNSGEYVVSTLNVALEEKNIPLMGGITTSVPEGEKPLVSCNGICYTNASVFAIIHNLHGEVHTGRENIYAPRPEKYIITRSDNENVIYELNGKKAVDVYADALQTSHNSLDEKIITNPLCRTMGDEHFLCAIKSFNKDGSISTYKHVQDNDTMQITDIMDNYREITQQTMDTIKADHAVAIMTVNCLFRYIYFDSLHYVQDYANMTETAVNHFGMIAEGEEINNQHVNQSMVYIYFK